MKIKLTILLFGMATGVQAMAIEKPDYEVLYQDGNVEYRSYMPYLVAESTVVAAESRSQAANEGFPITGK